MIKLIKSEKNMDMIVHENFTYTVAKIGQRNTLWRCTKRSCTACGHTSNNYVEILTSFVLNRAHNHPCDELSAIYKVKIWEMKSLMSLNVFGIKNIYSSVMRGCSLNDTIAIGRYETVSKILRNYRATIINPKPYLFDVVNLSKKITTTYRNEKFYQYGPGNYENNPIYRGIQLFFSDSMLNFLKQSRVWCVDGTFSVVPAPHYQLYTISFLENNHVYPVVYAILDNKLEETYINVFKVLFLFTGRISPLFIKTDFEIAAINALKLNFPDSIISTCQFHLGQSLLRKVKELSIFVDYKTIPNIKKHVRILVALSYVTPLEVENTFFAVKENVDFPQILTSLYDYFYRNYIRGGSNSRYPISLWNCGVVLDMSIPKTNNAIEGWHSVFRNTFGTSRYSYELLVFKMKEEEEWIQQKRIQALAGYSFSLKKRYVTMESRLNQFLLSSVERSGLDFVLNLVRLIYY